MNEHLSAIPELNFSKNENEDYIFYSDIGKIKNKSLGLEFNIYFIQIQVSSTIKISFISEYPLCHCINSMSKSYIECKSKEYYLKILNFTSGNLNSNFETGLITGNALKIKLTKNNDLLEKGEMVNRWDIFESKNIQQNDFDKFDLGIGNENIFLKSSLPEDISEETSELIPFKNNTFISYIKPYDENLNKFLYNFENLLYFYESNIITIRMNIIESSNKLEIVIPSKNISNLKGESIFSKKESNFLKFINSTYINYLKVKNEENINIDLLIYYYVWIKNEKNPKIKLILSAEFLEVFKNDTTHPEKNEQYKIYKRLKNIRLPNLQLKSDKLLQFLQPEIYNYLLNIKQKLNKSNEFKSNKIHSVWKKFNETYLPHTLEFYRNKIVHTGQYKMKLEDLIEFSDEWSTKVLTETSNQDEIIEKMSELIKQDLNIINSIFDVKNQSLFIEYFIEIILLALLEVKCELDSKSRFKTIVNSEVSYDSEKYLKKLSL